MAAGEETRTRLLRRRTHLPTRRGPYRTGPVRTSRAAGVTRGPGARSGDPVSRLRAANRAPAGVGARTRCSPRTRIRTGAHRTTTPVMTTAPARNLIRCSTRTGTTAVTVHRDPLPRTRLRVRTPTQVPPYDPTRGRPGTRVLRTRPPGASPGWLSSTTSVCVTSTARTSLTPETQGPRAGP